MTSNNNNSSSNMTSTSRGSSSSSNGLLPVTIASNHPDVDVSTNGDHYDDDDDDDLLVDPNDPFDITQTKNAPPETLKRWRVRHQSRHPLFHFTHSLTHCV